MTKEGWLPKKSRPRYDAVTVAMVTGTRVRALTS